MRPLKAFAVGLLIAAGVWTTTGNLWVVDHQSLEHQLAAMRDFYGLPPLTENPAMTVQASAHSWEMALSESLYHSSNLAETPQPWTVAGETVGVAGEPWRVVRAFMDSPSHRAVLLGDWSEVGFGHIRSADGRVWVTLRFKK